MGNINYHQVESFGFKRVDYNDNVVYRESGHHPFHMTKNLPGRLVIYWIADDRHCEMLRVDKQDNILGKKIIEEVSELIQELVFFGFAEDVKGKKREEALYA